MNGCQCIKVYISTNQTDLVWMFDMDAEAQLLQHTTLSFDHLVLGINVILIKDEWGAPG